MVPATGAIETGQKTFEAMQTWPHWKEIARGAQKEYGMTEEEFFAVLPEYQRFMALSRAFPGLGMLSERVDIIWHAHILNTIRYRDFNEQYIGRFVNHLPCSSYELYGLSPVSQGSICKEPPASCTDPFPAPPDPSPVPDEDRSSSVRQAILDGSPLFVQAYTSTFGYPPSHEFWPRTAFVDAIAQ